MIHYSTATLHPEAAWHKQPRSAHHCYPAVSSQHDRPQVESSKGALPTKTLSSLWCYMNRFRSSPQKPFSSLQTRIQRTSGTKSVANKPSKPPLWSPSSSSSSSAQRSLGQPS